MRYQAGYPDVRAEGEGSRDPSWEDQQAGSGCAAGSKEALGTQAEVGQRQRSARHRKWASVGTNQKVTWEG